MIVLYIIAIYILTGIIFSVPFLTKWIDLIDGAAEESPWTFKLMILPGCIVFWPVLMQKCQKAWKGKRYD